MPGLRTRMDNPKRWMELYGTETAMGTPRAGADQPFGRRLSRRVRKKPTKTMAKIGLCWVWAPWPSASATDRQTGWSLHQRGWWNGAWATLQRRPRHAWASVDLDGFLERRASGDWFSRDISWAGGNDSLHDARARLKISPCARLKISWS